MKSIAVLAIILIIFISKGLCQEPLDISDSNLSIGTLNFKVITNKVKGENETTNLTVNKYVEPIGSTMRFKYDIVVPKIDDFYFVLALDSSASLKTYPGAAQANAIIKAVPMFIDNTVNKYKNNKNFNISVISWDDDIDFAYSGLNNTDPKTARLVPIQKASEELKNGIFGEIDDPNYYYRAEGSDGTNLSIGLSGAIDVLKNNPIVRYHRTSKFIIIVAGEGEFKKCNESQLITEAQHEGISIYAIILNPSVKGEMLGHLKRLTDNKTQSCEGAGEELPKLLESQLENALAQAISEPAATNVTLTEPFYSYLEIGNEALIELKGKNFPVPYIAKSEIRNSSVSFKIKDGLLADNVTTVTFENKIGFSLPGSFVDVSPSFLNYTWLKEKDGFSIPISRNSITMTSVPGPLETEPLRGSMGSGFRIMTLGYDLWAHVSSLLFDIYWLSSRK